MASVVVKITGYMILYFMKKMDSFMFCLERLFFMESHHYVDAHLCVLK